MNYEIKSENGLKLEVSDQGAEMTSLTLNGTEYLWQGDPAYWTEHAPVLFPFVGRFTDGKYCLGEKEYPMLIHGFAKRSAFQVEKKSESSVTMTLTDSEKTLEQYPFHFCLKVTYSVQKNRVSVKFHVENRDDTMMYFGIGGHPGFNVPLEQGLSFEDYYLQFAETCRPDRVIHTEDCFVAGRTEHFALEDGRIIRLHHDLFDDDAIVLQDECDCVTLRSDKGQRAVTVSYPGLPYLGIWHKPKSDAHYVAIEPWVSLPSRKGIVEDFRYKNDLVRLPGKKNWETEWYITVQ